MIRSAAMATALVLLTGGSVSACSTGNDYYDHDPYKGDRVISRGLVHAQDNFVRALHSRSAATIRNDLTAPPKAFAQPMAVFVSRYAGYPARTIRRMPGDDATADQLVSIRCAPGRVQQVDIAWAWFDGAWRAWPADLDRPYPGC